MSVSHIKRDETIEWLLHKHYARRVPSISWALGLFFNGNLCAVMTIGKSCSTTLAKGICGPDNAVFVQELNRLVANDGLPRNSLSWFMGRALRMLPPMILVSYADPSKGHHGYIYQSTNWIYTGLSSGHKDPAVKGLEGQHHSTYANGRSRGAVSMSKLRYIYGASNVYLIDRARKHRFVKFIGSKKQKKMWLKSLVYPILPYPKGDNSRYDASYTPSTQGILFI
jgi:hypothetical protein